MSAWSDGSKARFGRVGLSNTLANSLGPTEAESKVSKLTLYRDYTVPFVKVIAKNGQVLKLG